jgi:superfamily I DNA/RNA helicase
VAKPKFSFVLTEQQEHAKRLMIEGEHLLLSAYAGASKTTTLVVCAWEVADETGKYLGFNKSTAKDASGKFPPKCQCLTTHSLAFHAVAKKYLNAGKVLPGDDKYRRLWARDIAGILGIRDGYRGQTAKLPRDGMASLAKETVTRFCYSADDHVGTQHVPKINGSEEWDATEKAEVIALVTHYAGLYWSDVMDLYGKLNYDHDHYLKQYQLTKPVLKLDYLMLDEGQDTNPAVFDIFSRQGEHAQKSKGQEYLKVRIASDFGPPEPNEETGQVTLNHSEMRLTYVAVTRAQEALDAEALAWVEDWLPTKTEVRA